MKIDSLHKRAQAALEFLTTYGWAFLVILIMIGALSYFGVLSPASLVPQSCVASEGWVCDEYQANKDQASGALEIVFQNSISDVTINRIRFFNVEGISGITPTVSASGVIDELGVTLQYVDKAEFAFATTGTTGGTTGSPGTTGTTSTGTTDSPGTTGTTSTGTTGSPGTTGTTSTGTTDSPGTTGTTSTGTTGSPGTTGPSGPTGPTGSPPSGDPSVFEWTGNIFLPKNKPIQLTLDVDSGYEFGSNEIVSAKMEVTYLPKGERLSKVAVFDVTLKAK